MSEPSHEGRSDWNANLYDAKHAFVWKFAFQSDRPSWDGSLIAGLAASLFSYGASTIRKAIWRAIHGFRRLAESSERVLCCCERSTSSPLSAQDIYSQCGFGETVLSSRDKFRARPSAFRANRNRQPYEVITLL